MKLSKSEVDYEHPAAKSDHCGICRHFNPPHGCEVVAGVIRPEDWCKRFRRTAARAMYGVAALFLVCLLGWPILAWAVNANPVPGSVWTWLGPTFGADWVQPGSGPTSTLNLAGPATISVNPPSFNSIVPIVTVLNADPINSTNTGASVQEEVANFGMHAITGQGLPSPGSNKVALTVGIIGQKGGGTLWAVNNSTFFDPTYNSTLAFGLTEEMDIVKDGNAGFVDPRPGKAGMQFPVGPQVVPTANTSAPTATSSNVLTFASGVLPTGPLLAVGATIKDLTNPAAILRDTYVTAFTATSVTMSGNPAATVNTGDKISFTIIYDYGLILESCCNQDAKATAAVVMSGAAPWYRGAVCDGSQFIEGCFIDYSNTGPGLLPQGAAFLSAGRHVTGLDLTNANIVGHPIELPGSSTGAGYIGFGDWLESSIGGDTGFSFQSIGGVNPKWTLQTVVSAGSAGRFRLVDATISQEMVAWLKGNPTAGNTSMQLLVNNTEGVSLVPVTLGAPNTCGAGLRCLAVPN